MRAFLFACITGMRHSDVRIFTPEKIIGDFIVFTPYKTQCFGNMVRVPLTEEAMVLVRNEMDEIGRNTYFDRICKQNKNEIITEIGKVLEIAQKLCFKVVRETFATLYMKIDGKLELGCLYG